MENHRPAGIPYGAVFLPICNRTSADTPSGRLICILQKNSSRNQLQDLEDRLKEFKVNILAQKLLHLSYMWFGTREECASMETKEEELQVFDILEKNVFYGMTGNLGRKQMNRRWILDQTY